MTLKRRLFYYICMIFGQNLYLPINIFNHGGTTVDIWLDKLIPAWPVWVPIYFVWIPAWMLAYLWAAIKMDERLYRALFIASMSVFLPAMLIFVLYPTYVVRPSLNGTDFFTNWLRWIYSNDRAYNALPSGHIYLTLLVVFFWSRWFPRMKWWLWGIFIIVALSTLFTKQHVIVDLVGGFILAWIGYRFGMWCIFKFKSDANPPGRKGKNVFPEVGSSQAQERKI